MTLEQFFLRPQMNYPITYHGDFRLALQEHLSAYADSLGDWSDSAFRIDVSSLQAKTQDLVRNVLECVDFLLGGRPGVAYSRFSAGLLPYKTTFLSEVFSMTSLPTYSGFYRMRSFESPPFDLCRNDLFHVPFSLRTKIAPQRFSISGYPCLYLGSSSLVCWHEIGRPALKECVVARYEIWNDSSTTLLYLAYHPQLTPAAIRWFMENSPLWRNDASIPQRVLASILLIYPLIIASHFVVQKPSDPFKPEYIIPQLILQWMLSETSISGVSFISTQVDFTKVPLPLSLNYVFPVPSDTNEYGEFRERFSSSQPFMPTETNVEQNWSVIQPTGRYFGPKRAFYGSFANAIGDG